MWIKRLEWHAIVRANQSLEKQVTKKDEAYNKAREEATRLMDNRNTLRSLDSQLFHGDVEVNVVDFPTGEQITVFYPKGWPLPTFTVTNTTKGTI